MHSISTRTSAIADCTVRRVCRHLANGDKKRILPIWVDAFTPKLYGNRVIPCQNVDWYRSTGSWFDWATTLPLEVFRQWNFV